MKRETFILTQSKDFRRSIRVFLKDKEDKLDARRIKFTTEHKVSEKQRNTNARKIPAEFSTNDEKIYDAMLRSTGYGITFVLKGDPKGELKREPIDITPMDAKKIALKNLFEEAGLNFDNKKSNEVLEQEYQIYANTKAGTKIKGSGPAKVPHQKIDVSKQLEDTVKSARDLYKEKYNEDVPEDFANDKAFLSAMADPKFDAKAYMEKAGEATEESIEDVRAEYFEVIGANVANPKKNDAAWMKQKIAEKKGE